MDMPGTSSSMSFPRRSRQRKDATGTCPHPQQFGSVGSNRSVHGAVPRAFWRVRQCARHGHSALAFIVDMALRGDMEGVQEHLGLLIVGIERYAQDGKWELGFLLLLEDPPHQMWSYRNPVGALAGRTRAFAPLCPQRWATISLAYLKELDFIQNRCAEAAKKEQNANQPAQPNPKRKGGNPSRTKRRHKPSLQRTNDPLCRWPQYVTFAELFFASAALWDRSLQSGWQKRSRLCTTGRDQQSRAGTESYECERAGGGQRTSALLFICMGGCFGPVNFQVKHNVQAFSHFLNSMLPF